MDPGRWGWGTQRSGPWASFVVRASARISAMHRTHLLDPALRSKARSGPLADSCGDGTVAGKGACFFRPERRADMLNARMARQLARWTVPIGAAAICAV